MKLYIIAAGLSSRMGYPKHLSKNSYKNYILLNTIHFAKKQFNEIYLILNEKLSDDYKKESENVFSSETTIKYITSGKGDADAIYQAIKDESDEQICVIWGDTLFTDKFFENNSQQYKTDNISVVCCYEKNPYTNFIIDDDYNIIETQLLGRINTNQYGWHDQSCFIINTSFFKETFIEYYKMIDDIITKTSQYIKLNIEYSIIKMINWLAKDKSYSIKIIPCAIKTYSYNSITELDEIIKSCYN